MHIAKEDKNLGQGFILNVPLNHTFMRQDCGDWKGLEARVFNLGSVSAQLYELGSHQSC